MPQASRRRRPPTRSAYGRAMSDPKAIGLSADLHAYAVAHGTPPDDVQQSPDRRHRRRWAASAGCRSRPSRARFMTILTQLVGARLRRRGRHVHRLLVAVHRPRPRPRRPPAVLRRQRGVDGGRPRALGARPGSTTASSCASPPRADTLRALPDRPADRPRVHRRRQDRLPRLLRRDRAPPASRRDRPDRQRALERQGRRPRPTRATTPRPSGRSTTTWRADDRVEVVLLPIADGLTIARKR